MHHGFCKNNRNKKRRFLLKGKQNSKKKFKDILDKKSSRLRFFYKSNILIYRISSVILLFLILINLHSFTVSAAEYVTDWTTLHAYGDICAENTRINLQNINGVNTLVFPSNVSPSAVKLYLDISDSAVVMAKGDIENVEFKNGDTIDLNELCSGEDYTLTFEAGEGTEASRYEVRFLFSGNISAMYLVSEDPENKGREWVESSADKSNKAKGEMVMQNADGSVVYDGALTQIKGRGNSTWGLEKKPYQIKLSSKTDLLETGNKENRSKTWVLLANYVDPTLLRNTIALNLGNAMGMETCMENRYVDLYYDGEYRGCYLLTEKVEVGSGRVDITDMEELNETANPSVDLESLPIATATTDNGATYTYCEGMNSPENITGGYLLEMDFAVRAVEEACYFYTNRGNYVVVKSPEYASKAEMEYISALYQEYEDALYNGGINPSNGKAYTDYVDLESMVQCYLINEFSKNRDGFVSSTFLYKETDKDVMTMGPLWDYDLSLGIGEGDLAEDVTPTGMFTARVGFGGVLSKIGSFKEKVKETYESIMYPLVKNVLLGNSYTVSVDGSLLSLSYYSNLIGDSVACDNAMWFSGEAWRSEVGKLDDFCAQRAEHLKEVFSDWTSENFVPKVNYVDVFASDWFYEEVHKASEYGLMVGIGGDTFDPYSYAERAQVAQVMYNMAKKPIVKFEQRFSDVNQHDWYSPAVTRAAINGITSGYPDGRFGATDIITREDLLVLLYRYCGSPVVSSDHISNFKDAYSVSGYARNAVEWALNEGIINGDNYRCIRPQNGATRAEMATILVHFYEKFVL